MIAIASDHAGYLLKEKIKDFLAVKVIDFTDFGTDSEESCNYPVFAKRACAAITDGSCDKAILVCGTGIGMSMAANKIKGIELLCAQTVFPPK